ncbi:MAG: hypothetical protein GY948_03690 [Alphaproteobacteria bacterium]|nr:hypothetical protein [Alphaproteobacteria bacterium]
MSSPRQIFLLFRTLLVGACGAVLFNAFGMPAAFMSGALVAVAAATLLGMEVVMPVGVRNAAFFCTGIFFGSTVDQETVQSFAAWPFSIFALGISLVAIMVLIPAR